MKSFDTFLLGSFYRWQSVLSLYFYGQSEKNYLLELLICKCFPIASASENSYICGNSSSAGKRHQITHFGLFHLPPPNVNKKNLLISTLTTHFCWTQITKHRFSFNKYHWRLCCTHTVYSFVWWTSSRIECLAGLQMSKLTCWLNASYCVFVSVCFISPPLYCKPLTDRNLSVSLTLQGYQNI